MARTTKQLSGGGKDKFLRALISEASLPADKATRLGNTLCGAIADIRVRRDAWEPVKQPRAAEPQAPAASEAPTSSTVAVEFDPFAFSALAVLTKQGPAALAGRLAVIDAAEQLHALAKAQHLAVDAGITEPTALRAAMITATEARLAERRAAAS